MPAKAMLNRSKTKRLYKRKKNPAHTWKSKRVPKGFSLVDRGLDAKRKGHKSRARAKKLGTKFHKEYGHTYDAAGHGV